MAESDPVDNNNDAQLLARMGTDGQKWAQEFCARNPHLELDIDFVQSWFANAIEAGREAGYRAGCEETIEDY